MSHSFGLMIESLVAVLLLLTIGYCVLLNSRLKRLKADEQALKGTISELITATEIAGRRVRNRKCKRNRDRSIDGIAATFHDVDANLRGHFVGGSNDTVSCTHRLARGCAHRVGRYATEEMRTRKCN